MFVEIVMRPGRPACAMTAASRASSRTLSTLWSSPSAESRAESASDSRTLPVPTSTGLPRAFSARSRLSSAPSRLCASGNTASGSSCRMHGRCGGTAQTERPYSRRNACAAEAAVPVMPHKKR